MFLVAAFAALALSQATDPTLPPAGARPLYTVQGRGVQIYRCTTADGNYQWSFQAPEAQLFDPATKKQVGTHAAGPIWTWSDGSSLSGKVIAKEASPDPANLPWLLLEAHPAGPGTGALAAAAFVRRSDTHGGNAPAGGCDAQHGDDVVRVPYSATYTFYTPQSK